MAPEQGRLRACDPHGHTSPRAQKGLFLAPRSAATILNLLLILEREPHVFMLHQARKSAAGPAPPELSGWDLPGRSPAGARGQLLLLRAAQLPPRPHWSGLHSLRCGKGLFRTETFW